MDGVHLQPLVSDWFVWRLMKNGSYSASSAAQPIDLSCSVCPPCWAPRSSGEQRCCQRWSCSFGLLFLVDYAQQIVETAGSLRALRPRGRDNGSPASTRSWCAGPDVSSLNLPFDSFKIGASLWAKQPHSLLNNTKPCNSSGNFIREGWQVGRRRCSACIYSTRLLLYQVIVCYCFPTLLHHFIITNV